jgi:hypothetical protein
MHMKKGMKLSALILFTIVAGMASVHSANATCPGKQTERGIDGQTGDETVSSSSFAGGGGKKVVCLSNGNWSVVKMDSRPLRPNAFTAPTGGSPRAITSSSRILPGRLPSRSLSNVPAQNRLMLNRVAR